MLVDKNRDGDMADEGEIVPGVLGPNRESVTFNAGDIYYLDKMREDQRFVVSGMVVSAQADADPMVQIRADMLQKTFGNEEEYELVGPHGDGMRFSPDLAEMPTVNMTPEIVASPDFKGKEIQLVLEDGGSRFEIGETHELALLCLTGDPNLNDFVFALKNSSFEKPVLATLIYRDQEGETRGAEFELRDWKGDFGFAGSISIPGDAAPGRATLVVNFSETETDGDRERPTHFTQVVRGGASYMSETGEEVTSTGWQIEVELVR